MKSEQKILVWKTICRLSLWFIAEDDIIHLVSEIVDPAVYPGRIFSVLLHVVDVELVHDVMYILVYICKMKKSNKV